MAELEDDDEEIEFFRAEERAAAKAAIAQKWSVERRDNDDGSILYEVWSDGSGHRVCRITDNDNPAAARDADHIAALHNSSLDPKFLTKAEMHAVVFAAAMRALEVGAPGLAEGGRMPIAINAAVRASAEIEKLLQEAKR